MSSDESKQAGADEPIEPLTADSGGEETDATAASDDFDISQELANIVKTLEESESEEQPDEDTAPADTDVDPEAAIEVADDESEIVDSEADAAIDIADSEAPLDDHDMEDRLDNSGELDELSTESNRGDDPIVESPELVEPESPAPEEFAEAAVEPSAPKPKAPDEVVESAVGGENVAAAGTVEADSGAMLSEDLLDRLLKEAEDESDSPEEPAEESAAKGEDPPRPEEAAAPEPAAVDEKPAEEVQPEAAPQSEDEAEPVAQEHTATDIRRILAAVAAGLIGGLSVFTYLYTHQLRPLPPSAEMAATDVGRLQRAHSFARELLDAGNAPEALGALRGVLESAPPGPERTEARFTNIEARYRTLPASPTERQTDVLHEEIDNAVEDAHGHPRVPEALYWKALLYRDTGNTIGARATLGSILEDYPDAARSDLVLYELARMELALGRPTDSISRLETLLSDHGTSSVAGDGRLLLGDALAKAGETERARTTYIRLAQSFPDSPVGVAAFERLGQLAYDEGRYDDAIRELETRLETATSIDGNDAVYLLLAKAYRQKGDPEKSRTLLNELIEFFPDSEVIPPAHVELSQVLRELGRPSEALRFATQAAQRFPDRPEVLRNEGDLLAETGDAQAAARALSAADRAGASDPELLLSAGRNFQKAGELQRARRTFDQVVERFPDSPESIAAAIESARTLYDEELVGLALERAEELATSTEGALNRLPVLHALAGFYEDLGLKGPMGDAYAELSSLTDEPAMLAQAAVGLLQSGRWDDGMDVAKRLDIDRLDAAAAYALLMAQGDSLLRVNPTEAMALMDRAYQSYPEQRTTRGNLRYLRANLATERSARARIIVEELFREVQQNREDPKRLVGAAVAYGDFLFDRGDFRAAAEAYAKALYPAYLREELVGQPVIPFDEQQHWALYQRANALLNLSQYEDSLALYEQVEEMKGPWTAEAAARSSSARLELRLRGGATVRGEQTS